MPDDWPKFRNFRVMYGPMEWEDAVSSVGLYAQGHRREYDYMPDGPVLRHTWYVYHFYDG